jgi:hypothetical protein
VDAGVGMGRARLAFHASVIVLFLIATAFYLLAASTSAMILALCGAVVEVAAWTKWLAERSDERRDRT